jgi:hypothetical protein
VAENPEAGRGMGFAGERKSGLANREDMIRVNATIDIPAAALQAVVDNARQKAGRDEKGGYRVDTYEKLGEMISRFLREKDFLSYARDMENYE